MERKERRMRERGRGNKKIGGEKKGDIERDRELCLALSMSWTVEYHLIGSLSF